MRSCIGNEVDACVQDVSEAAATYMVRSCIGNEVDACVQDVSEAAATYMVYLSYFC